MRKNDKNLTRNTTMIIAFVVVLSVTFIPLFNLSQHVKAFHKEDVKQNIQTETIKQKKDSKSVFTEATNKSNVSSDYSPKSIKLSDYDRNKVERLVTGEAGSLGFEGCVLVAQAIRDSMILSDTSSINKIIKDYKYTGSTDVNATIEAKEAVSYVFDKCGYGVNHRILYFYATNLVDSPWHESQKYVTTCANLKFFDKN